MRYDDYKAPIRPDMRRSGPLNLEPRPERKPFSPMDAMPIEKPSGAKASLPESYHGRGAGCSILIGPFR